MNELPHKDNNRKRSSHLFPVVGVGASAGGLDAFKRLIRTIPEKSGIAYILVQHLEPSHESLLGDILQKVTQLPVEEITDNVHIQPDHIYVIPANKFLTANEGRLELSPRTPKKEKNRAIDVFFTSLAEVHQEYAIGVVLSGTGADGTLGLQVIKDHGGVTIVQEPKSASFDGMPQSAIDAGVADFVLVPEEIPMHLTNLFETFKNGLKDTGGEKDRHTRDEVFRQLLSQIRIRKGTDFTYYKQTTIRRRIIRRMGLNKIASIGDYLAYFNEHVPEQDLLYQDLLIPVTAFFRDPGTYKLITDTIFPDLLKSRGEANPLRIWIAGCSTGEEPYSIAISLNEYLGNRIGACKIQIFATDISEKAIAKARSGVYTKRDMGGLSAELVEKYFSKVNGSFQINKSIRDMCVFASHNFLKDPPFARMDFISCRNVLIYMEAFLQKRALTTFHYALKENGYLLLGKSETAAPASDLFTINNKSDKIYTRKSVPGKLLPVTPERAPYAPSESESDGGKQPARNSFQKSADETILSRFNPPGVVVNEQMDIVQFRGSTGAWLESPPGKPSLNIFKMARPGLAFELRNALHKTTTENIPVVKEHILMDSDSKQKWTTIEVIPLLNTVERFYLIVFRESMVVANDRPGVENSETHSQTRHTVEMDRIQQLEQELAQLREDIRSVTEAQEAANEQLQSANEELLSSNEELQSLNEELETSKEEIQSSNEELTTLNQELFDRNDQLDLSRLYAESIIATIREPLIILDRDLKIKTANRSYYKKFMTSEGETEGKSLFSLANGQWDIPPLRMLLERFLLENGRVTGFEVKHRFEDIGARILLLNACQITRTDDHDSLILLAIEDITEARNREEDLFLFSQELETKVQERTASLLEANTALKLSNENLEQFATIASHDLQEPLRKIRTFSALLQKRHNNEITGEAGELIHKIDLSAQRMSALIHDVLNFSKILDASIFVRADLSEILRKVIGDFDLLIAEKKAVITNEPLPAIEAVSLQMSQLFYNLLGNALKFSKPQVPPLIHISGRILPPADVPSFPTLDEAIPYCEIVFRDNGIGIDPHFSEQIFGIFQRLNVREHFEGTGIGLALCKRIVLSHKGEIYVDPNDGTGSAFHVILPVRQQATS